MEINTLVGIQNQTSPADAPNGTPLTTAPPAPYDNSYGYSTIYPATAPFTSKDFCYWDTNWGMYVYYHVFK